MRLHREVAYVESIGWRAGPWIPLELLGRGGMGEVWLARHADRATRVGLKIFRFTGDPEASVRTFWQEVGAVSALEHPHVIRIADAGALDDEAGAGAWIAMELAEGGNALQHWPATWDALHELLVSVLTGLAHTHARGVVHLDLKPGNVLWTGGAHARWVLADFGLAQAVFGTAVEAGRVSGTPAYMAPEQILGQTRRLGPATDLYALGCLAWELACGTPPHPHADHQAVLRGHLYDPLPELLPRMSLPVDFEPWVQRLLARSPRDRFRMAADALGALRGFGDAMQPAGAASVAPKSYATPTFTWEAATFDLPAEEERAPVAVPPIPDDWRVVEPEGREADPLAAIQGRAVRLLRLRRWELVGREQSRDALWQGLRGELPARVDLTGVLGSGRTALAAWLLERVQETGSAYGFAVRCEEPGWEAELVERLSRVLDRPAPESSTEFERHASAVRMLGQLSEERPVVLVLDGPDRGADRLARRLTGRSAQWRVLIVRIESPRPAEGSLALGPLARDRIDAMLAEQLDLDRGLAVRLVDAADGIPGRVVELVLGLAERDVLIVEGSRLRLPVGTELELGTVEDLVAARARMLLAGRMREPLLIAAVLGSTVRTSQLEAAGADVPTGGPLVPTEEPGVLRFEEPGLRRALIDAGRALPEWPSLAERAAAVTTEPWRRGSLWLEAGRVDEGLELLMQEAQYVSEDPGRARAVQALLLPWVDRLEPEDQVSYWRNVALEVTTSGSPERTEEVLTAAGEAASRCRSRAHEVDVLLDRFFYQGIQVGDMDLAERYLDAAIRAAGVPPVEEAAGRLAECRGYLLFQRGDYEGAAPWLEIAVADPLLSASVRAYALERLARVRREMGQLEEALAIADRAVEVAGPRPTARGTMLVLRAHLAYDLGRKAQAIADCREAIQAWAREDHPTLPLAWLTLAEFLEDEPREERDALEAALGLARDVKMRMWELVAHLQLLRPAARLGEWARYEEHLEACQGWLQLQGFNRRIASSALQDYAPLVEPFRPDLAARTLALSAELAS